MLRAIPFLHTCASIAGSRTDQLGLGKGVLAFADLTALPATTNDPPNVHDFDSH